MFSIFGWFVSNIIYNYYPSQIKLFGYDIYNLLLNHNIFIYFSYYVWGIDIVNSTYFYEHFPLSKYHFNAFYSGAYSHFLFIISNIFLVFLFIIFTFLFRFVKKMLDKIGSVKVIE